LYINLFFSLSKWLYIEIIIISSLKSDFYVILPTLNNAIKIFQMNAKEREEARKEVHKHVYVEIV